MGPFGLKNEFLEVKIIERRQFGEMKKSKKKSHSAKKIRFAKKGLPYLVVGCKHNNFLFLYRKMNKKDGSL